MFGKKKPKDLADKELQQIVDMVQTSSPFDHAMRNRVIDVLLNVPAIQASAGRAVDNAIDNILSDENNIDWIKSRIRLSVNTSTLPLLDQLIAMDKDKEAVISTLNLINQKLDRQDIVMHDVVMNLLDVQAEDEKTSSIVLDVIETIRRLREKNTDILDLIQMSGKQVLYK